MNDYRAVALAEGFEKPASDDVEKSYEEMRAAWQHLIDTGLAWRLQGWFGRTTFELIANGTCLPFPRPENHDA